MFIPALPGVMNLRSDFLFDISPSALLPGVPPVIVFPFVPGVRAKGVAAMNEVKSGERSEATSRGR